MFLFKHFLGLLYENFFSQQKKNNYTLAYQYADHGSAYTQYAAPLSYAQAPG